jgi:hypothetical protein
MESQRDLFEISEMDRIANQQKEHRSEVWEKEEHRHAVRNCGRFYHNREMTWR